MGFWSVSINAFVFPWGRITPTLLDAAAILGLLLRTKEVHSYINHKITDHGYAFANNGGDANSTFVEKNAKKLDTVSIAEHA